MSVLHRLYNPGYVIENEATLYKGDYKKDYIPFFGIGLDKADYFRTLINTNIKFEPYDYDALMTYIYDKYEYCIPYMDRVNYTIRNKSSFFVTEHTNISRVNDYVFPYIAGKFFASRIIDSIPVLDEMNKFICLPIIETLFVLVIPVQYVSYIKLCLISGEEINPNILQMWVHPMLNVKDTPFVVMRSIYKKHILPTLKELKIPIIEKTNIEKELFYIPEQLSFKSIGQYKEYLNSFGKEFIQMEREALSL